MARKQTKAEVARRVDQVSIMLIKGATYSMVVRYCSDTWGISSRQADNYIARARKQNQRDLDEIRPFVFAELIANVRMIRAKSLAGKIPDYRLALDCIKEEAKLLDLYPAQRHTHDIVWKREIVGLVNSGQITVNDVKDEFGVDLAVELFGNLVV